MPIETPILIDSANWRIVFPEPRTTMVGPKSECLELESEKMVTTAPSVRFQLQGYTTYA